MSDQAVITLIGTLGLVLFFVVVCGLPQDLMDRWSKSRAEAARARVEETNGELKRAMIERGFSADEIVQVINAGSEEAVGTDAGGKTPA